ncbi:GerAB/ArcD/ProY family transporter [Shimazuella alba]|uniref:Endospore germination permease n=1 Tax=Shimazuella alba TaxID=2690964 RepID=A0A6I4VL77_9BACL|nr:endospore germination permease [Shimazuella alba]MXQ52187.1 endospore germination permease [Shimazuella alba]
MFNKKFSLSFSQYVFLIYKTQIGVGVLTLPHDLFVISGSDGWIAIIIGWMISTIVSFLIINTLEKNPDETLFDLLPRYFGKWLGKIILVCWILYALFAASYSFMYTVYLIKVWVLPNTNPVLIGLLFIIPIYQITRLGLPMISRYAEFTFLITIWMYPIILITAQEGIWLNLMPIARDGFLPILKSTPVTALSFLGFEMAFVLYPRLQNKKKAFKGILLANTMTAIVLIMVTVLSYIRLSETELAFAVWPTLDLIKLVHFPFLERLEIIFISAYIIILFMSVIPYLHMALIGSSNLFQRSIKKPLLPVILTIWVGGLFFPIIGFQPVISIKKMLSTSGLIFAFLFPVVFWIYSKVFLAICKKGQVKG